MKRICRSLPAILAGCFLSNPSLWAGTFSIESIHVHPQGGDISSGITAIDKTQLPRRVEIFIPQVEVQIKVARDAVSQNLIAKAYYYDSSGQLIQAFARPSPAVRPVSASDSVRGTSSVAVWPTILPANTLLSIYFPLPSQLPSTWTLVIVFGNAHGVVAASVPDGQQQKYSYPEQDLVARTLLSPEVDIDNRNGMAPLIEQVVKSDNPAYPAFTLLLHLSHGVSDPRDVKGVLAMCMIANSVGEIRDKLNAIKPEKDPNAYFAFAEAHQLAVIAWGARWVWSSYANFDELDQDQTRTRDDNFQTLADAWDHGVQRLVDQYGIPDHDYLMYGFCAGGEWVHRLALHKPDRFLAVQMHISTSYDAPTPEAGHIMWLLTTGELDNGCDRARRFYAAARDLQYPIIFKAMVGLGHSDCAAADRLGVRFFEYALDLKSRRDAAIAMDPNHTIRPLDLSGFYSSPFYGDLMNQEMFAAQDKEMIPQGFLVPLPDRDIADAWNK
jgi:predicted esterase